MARIRADYVFGTVEDTGGLTDVATSLTSAGLSRLPAVSGGDVAAITLYDSASSAFEIVHVTAHTASATTATILRAQEGTTAQVWAEGAAWVHGLTASDMAASSIPFTPTGTIASTDVQAAIAEVASEAGGGGGSGGGSAARGLDRVPGSPSTYDDEFAGTTLDAKWAQVTSATGQGATASFDDGVLQLEPTTSGIGSTGKHVVGIRQASPAGSFSVAAKVSGDGYTDLRPGIFVSSTTANKFHIGGPSYNTITTGRAVSFTAGAYSETGDWGTSDGFFAETADNVLLGWTWQRVRWDSAASTLYFDVSVDGFKWRQFGQRTGQSQPDRLGLALYSSGGSLDAAARLSVEWFRVTTP